VLHPRPLADWVVVVPFDLAVAFDQQLPVEQIFVGLAVAAVELVGFAVVLFELVVAFVVFLAAAVVVVLAIVASIFVVGHAIVVDVVAEHLIAVVELVQMRELVFAVVFEPDFEILAVVELLAAAVVVVRPVVQLVEPELQPVEQLVVVDVGSLQFVVHLLHHALLSSNSIVVEMVSCQS